MLKRILFLFLLTISWPVLQLFVFFVRFHKLPLSLISGSLVFLSLGFLSAFLLQHLLSVSRSKKQKQYILIGYMVTVPFAVVSSLLGGLVLIPELGVTIFGLVPLCLGMFAGYFIKRKKRIKERKGK